MRKLLLTNLLAVAIISTHHKQQEASADEARRKMMRRRAEGSADGFALMTSSVTSSYSADGLREQSQESAGSLHPDARGSDVVEEAIQSQATVHQQMLFGESNSKTMSFT
ncbi:pentatricopeptide repeat-containing protein chloroplastic [Dorcoceras hygrometricum]|uniref:Pentatricopeptide repeat-containing protein chloroplastic n=1 Tax=Dorcoceras hygrometricum TaxID=472368 RepID=A0A2Z7CEK5_9LAMI|nr:pentatricopeptide repeat-containing protein chloroplastic [Dorcoceras hygrometricum]